MAVQFIRYRAKNLWYVYAYKGGPRILVHKGSRKPRLGPKEHKKIADALAAKCAEPDHLFRHVIRQWQRGADWERLEASTRRVWQRHVNLIEDRWGEFPFTIWDDARMAAKVMKWRDERKATPRTSDIGVTVLRALLKWAKLNGYVTLNVASEIPQLASSANREEIIWTEDDIAAFTTKAVELERPQIVDGLRLAALTGLRRADLVSLTFDHIGEFAISKIALKKSGGRRRKATIPMTDDLRELLDELRGRHRAEGVDTVLVNSFGKPWSGDGFGGSFNRVRDAANIVHRDEDGNERKKHLHDVRGTFCTMLMAECGLTDEEAASIMAWSKERIGRIRQVYVDDESVVVAIGQRMAAKNAAKKS